MRRDTQEPKNFYHSRISSPCTLSSSLRKSLGRKQDKLEAICCVFPWRFLASLVRSERDSRSLLWLWASDGGGMAGKLKAFHEFRSAMNNKLLSKGNLQL